MLGRTVEVFVGKRWYPGTVREVETGVHGNSMEVRLLPSPERILPAYVVVAPETEGTLWRDCTKPGGEIRREEPQRGNRSDMKTIGSGTV